MKTMVQCFSYYYIPLVFCWNFFRISVFSARPNGFEVKWNDAYKVCLRQIHGLSEFHASYQPALDSLVLSRENPALLFIKIQDEDEGRLSSID